jgi:predicted AlkP superfamily pyrophosphatase or phosphodiesterase
MTKPAACLLVLLALAAGAANAAVTERPRLVVLVVVDQLPRESLDRFAPLFPAGGFRRLMEKGADFAQCRHGHFPTYTGPGHAVMLTGAYANRHGVVGNRWYSRSLGRQVGAVEDERFPLIAGNAAASPTGGVSPAKLLSSTVGDVLRASTGGRAKVVSVALKDRTAVLLGGSRPSGAYWFDAAQCHFVTSTYYASELPGWVERFNAGAPCGKYAGGQWTKLRPDVDYAAFADADDAPYERDLLGLGRTFPHPVSEMAPDDRNEGVERYGAVAATPFGNELVAAFARAAIEAENLGGDGVPDLLAIGFSSNDAVGHLYGPHSQEFLDVTLRTDRQLADLMRDLDRRVGEGRWILALTSDHGASPIPEYLETLGVLPERRDDYRFDVEAARARVERNLAARFFGDGGPPAGFGGFFASFQARTMPFVYLDRTAAGRLPGRVSFAELRALAAEEIRALDGVARAYEPETLVSPGEDPFALAAARGWHPENGGDLVVQLRPYWLVAPSYYATSHGSPYTYDTHVPMLLHGKGIPSGRIHRPVAVADLASTLAALLGVSPPPFDEGRPLHEALE